MRLRDLDYKKPLKENIADNIPIGIRKTLPTTFIIPDMDPFYEYYRFITALACHPELDGKFADKLEMRDVPMVVAYTPQEAEMIKAVANRLGFEAKDISLGGSHEEEGGNVVSPVMKFNMTETQLDILKALTEYVTSDKRTFE